MICPKCNSQIPDNSKFCMNCGNSFAVPAPTGFVPAPSLSHAGQPAPNPAPAAQPAPAPVAQPTPAPVAQPAPVPVAQPAPATVVVTPAPAAPQPAPKKKSKKWIIWVVIAAVLLTAIGGGGAIAGKKLSKPYEKPLKLYLKACEEEDYSDLDSIFPPQVIEAIEEKDMCNRSFEEIITSGMDNQIFRIEYDYTIGDATKCSEKQIEKTEQTYLDELDLSLDCEAAYDIEVIAETSSKSDDFKSSCILRVIKVDGKWYIDMYYFRLSGFDFS